jgi:hypothetical protein
MVEQVDDDYFDLFSRMEDDAVLEVELSVFIKGDTPVERVSQMLAALVSYCRGFERFEPFKFEIGARKVHAHQDPDRLPVQCREYNKQPGTNPFSFGESFYDCHPVEMTLKKALIVSRQGLYTPETPISYNEALLCFKNHRKVALDYLEPQYQRILAVYVDLSKVVAEERKRGGIFGLVTRLRLKSNQRSQMAKVMVLLQRYNHALSNRDMPFEIETMLKYGSLKKKGVRSAAWKLKHEKTFPTPLGEISLERLELFFQDGDFDEFFDLCRIAIDDMDTQFLEIYHARSEIFKWDVFNQRGCGIAVNEPDSLFRPEMVDWDHDESDYDVPAEPSRRYGGGHSDAEDHDDRDDYGVSDRGHHGWDESSSRGGHGGDGKWSDNGSNDGNDSNGDGNAQDWSEHGSDTAGEAYGSGGIEESIHGDDAGGENGAEGARGENESSDW